MPDIHGRGWRVHHGSSGGANARKLDRVTFEEMLELASLGAKVLQIRSVEFASKYNVTLRVLSTFDPTGAGTLIAPEEEDVETPMIAGIAFNTDEAKLTVLGAGQPGGSRDSGAGWGTPASTWT